MAIHGESLGLITAYAILDSSTGKLHRIRDIVSGAGDTPENAVKGVGISNISCSRDKNIITLTFNLSDNTSQTVSFDLPSE